MNTIHFGNKAKNIKTVVKVNEVKNQNYQQMVLENEKLKKKLKQLEKELTTQKKLNMSEILTKNETNSNIKNRYLNLTAPEKINLNNSFSLCYTANNKENINNMNINYDISAYKYSAQNLHFNRTQLALSNMEKELTLLKQYLLTEQNENINNNFYNSNNYLDNISLRSSNNICRNLMNNTNYTYESKLYIPERKKITFCNVENFALNEKKSDSKDTNTNNKLKELEEENLRLKNELNLIRNNSMENSHINNPGIELDESSFEENDKNYNIKKNNNINTKQDYFFNKERKVLLSKYSKIDFIKSLSSKIKNLSENVPKKEKDDTKILIQLNQTIKNLNQNIISDIGDKNKSEKDKINFLKRKTSKNY